MDDRFDVIIVGGRVAGSTLAARLGKQNVKVLLIDRAAFPSLPAVSSPIIYACTMRLLDEIGADESKYAYNTPKVRRVATEARDYRALATIPRDGNRDYAYAIDRARFDAALWEHASTYPTVKALDHFAAVDLLRDSESGSVMGIVGKPKGEAPRNYYANIVVGADGHWSLVARKVDAQLYNEHRGRKTSLYYAYWRNLAPYDLPSPIVISHGTGDGLGYLVMDSADGTTAVVVEGFSDVLAHYDCGDAEQSYLDMLRHAPRIWERVKNAERVTSVRGTKVVDSFYRQAYGNGWALVGDALHHKDPLGGQGIYDAAFGAKTLAEAIAEYRAGIEWQTSMLNYQRRFEAETLPMYYHTLTATNNFEPQGYFQRLLGRYACENPEFVENLIRVPTRLIEPARVMDTPIVVRSVAKGVVRDVQRALTGTPSPAAIPPLPTQQSTVTSAAHSGMGCLSWLLVLPIIMLFGWGRSSHPITRNRIE
ncbi:MAG: NAD(P)/FAD-dependent oxidoreductase [Anaerolineae bacterium]|nr:NAD(P)/FAD-dependent oxidoreductase [Anaerolineae bacterium]